MSKEYPILFSGEMVRAILEGRKTMTRRVVKPQPSGNNRISIGKGIVMNIRDERIVNYAPYRVGGILYVRETWCPQLNIFGQPVEDRTPFYRADSENLPVGHKWKPSIFMPRNASRITLEITSVKVERLQEITEEDAEREGVLTWEQGSAHGNCYDGFHELWDSINAKRGLGWDINPWVWAISFKVL